MRETLKEAAEEVHSTLGVGFTESIYHRALERELSERGVPFNSEGPISVFYKGAPVGRRRPDMFVPTEDGTIILELKAGSSSGHDQLIQYLEILDQDKNFDICGGAVIAFNEELEFTYATLEEDESGD